MIIILQPGLNYRTPPGISRTEHLRNLHLYLWTKANSMCALCGLFLDPDQVHADHIIPQSIGGEDGVHNLQAVHKSCNSLKRDRPMEYAIERIRILHLGSKPRISKYIHYKKSRPKLEHYDPTPLMTWQQVLDLLEMNEHDVDCILAECNIKPLVILHHRVTNRRMWRFNPDEIRNVLLPFSVQCKLV